MKDWDIQINYGIKTGLNEAFIISGEKKDELIAADAKSAEIIRPILRGRDIKRYGYTFSDQWVILANFGSHNWLPQKYPVIFEYLRGFESNLRNRGQCRYTSSGKQNLENEYPGQHHWLELDNNPREEYLDVFYKQKIIYAETMRVHRAADRDRFPRFSYSEEQIFLDKTCFMITGQDLLYILPVMNSKLMYFIIRNNIAVMDTGGFLMQKIYIDHLPIPPANIDLRKKVETLACQIIKNRKTSIESNHLEKEIDILVYELFGFTQDESNYIENI